MKLLKVDLTGKDLNLMSEKAQEFYSNSGCNIFTDGKSYFQAFGNYADSNNANLIGDSLEEVSDYLEELAEEETF